MDDDARFQRIVMEGLVPKVADSHVCVAFMPSDKLQTYVDAKFCVELGVMIMLDKPILAIVQPGLEVPHKLQLVADEIVMADIHTPEGQTLVQKALEDFGERYAAS